MGKAETRFSTFMVCCIVGTVVGLLLVCLAAFPVTAVFLGRAYMTVLVIGFIIMVGSMAVGIIGFFVLYAGHQVSESKAAHLPPRTVAAKIHKVYRTDSGRVLSPEDVDELDNPKYHVVLITDENKRVEVETAPEIFVHCIEMAWGYAEIRGMWMGKFTLDAELYRKFSGR